MSVKLKLGTTLLQTKVLDIKGGIAKSHTNGPNSSAKASSGTSSLGGTEDPFQNQVSAKQTAPPDHKNADKSGPINPDEVGGLLDIDLVKAVAHARAQSSFVAGRKQQPISRAHTELAGIRVGNANTPQLGDIDNGQVLKTNVATSLTVNKLSRFGGKRSNKYATVSTARANTARPVKLAGGEVRLDVGGPARLKAKATGQNGGASVKYKAPTVRVSRVGGIQNDEVQPGDTQKIGLGGGSFVLISVLDNPNKSVSNDGTKASGHVVPIQVKVVLNGLVTANLQLLKLDTTAVAPNGGTRIG